MLGADNPQSGLVGLLGVTEPDVSQVVAVHATFAFGKRVQNLLDVLHALGIGSRGLELKNDPICAIISTI